MQCSHKSIKVLVSHRQHDCYRWHYHIHIRLVMLEQLYDLQSGLQHIGILLAVVLVVLEQDHKHLKSCGNYNWVALSVLE